jgi:NTP pyrophosphatase (non-canonical NTP hydrolase)
MQFVNDGVMLSPDTARERLLLATLGLAGESGEVVDLLKKTLFHHRILPRDELIKELGDVMWYFHLLLMTERITMDEVLEANMVKLIKRYPDKYRKWAVNPHG